VHRSTLEHYLLPAAAVEINKKLCNQKAIYELFNRVGVNTGALVQTNTAKLNFNLELKTNI